MVDRPFFVPFPYTYMIVGYQRDYQRHIYSSFLGVGFRPKPLTSKDQNISVFVMNNSHGGIVCLGNSWLQPAFVTEEESTRDTIETYFSSPFEGTSILLPRQDAPSLENFYQWSEFKTFSEIKVDWEKLDHIFDKNGRFFPYDINFV